jgi:hypothetical protein
VSKDDPSPVLRELYDVLKDLETLLKNGELGAELIARGVNTSLALVAVDGLRAYLEGDKEKAHEDLGTVAEEIEARLSLSRSGPGNGSGGGPA